MAPKVFVDSDVIIDFFTDRKPFVSPASKLFELNEKKLIRIYISAISLNNIYYIAKKYIGHKRTIKILEELTEITKVIGTTKKEILRAFKINFKDFEDAIQYSSALTVKDLSAIITRNTKDYSKADIAVITPENFVKALP